MVLAVQKLSRICGALDQVTLELVSSNGISTRKLEQKLDEIEQVFTHDIAGNLLYIGVRIKSLRGLLDDAKRNPATSAEADDL
jgi:hypothetical protein